MNEVPTHETARETPLEMTQAMSVDERPAPFHAVPDYRPEMQLLLCSGGPRLQVLNEGRMEKILDTAIDWELLFRLGVWHHMLPLVHWNLNKSKSSKVPQQVRDVLQDLFLRNVGVSLRMTGELTGILDQFADAGVIAVPYKGPVLASRLYGSLALRQSSDLDIVVRKSDVEKASEILVARAYAPSIMLHAANQRFQVESRYSERFDREDSIVELHWAFTNKDVAFPLTLEDLLPRLEDHRIDGCTMRVFSPEDLLLILSVHGAKHNWNRLEWTCGIAELIHQVPIRWDELFHRAEKTHSLRRLLLALVLAHDLFAVTLPDMARGRIDGDQLIIDLARHVTWSLYDGDRNSKGVDPFGSLEHDIFHYKLGDRTRDSLRYLAYRVTTPSRPDRWSTISVGGRSLSVHAFTRPFTVIGKLLPVLWRSVQGRLGIGKNAQPPEA